MFIETLMKTRFPLVERENFPVENRQFASQPEIDFARKHQCRLHWADCFKLKVKRVIYCISSMAKSFEVVSSIEKNHFQVGKA